MNRTTTIRAVLGLAVLATVALGAAKAFAAPSVATDRVALVIKTDVEHGKQGPNGKWHDAYLPAAATVRAGDRVIVTVRSYDSAPHTFTIAKLGFNFMVKGGGSASHPVVTTFSFRAPAAGTYTWTCLQPCEPVGDDASRLHEGPPHRSPLTDGASFASGPRRPTRPGTSR